MKLAKQLPVVLTVSQDLVIIVPTNVELIKPTVETELSSLEEEYWEKEYLLFENKNQYYHLAYSQY